MYISEAGVHLILVQPWGGLLIVYIVLFAKANIGFFSLCVLVFSAQHHMVEVENIATG